MECYSPIKNKSPGICKNMDEWGVYYVMFLQVPELYSLLWLNSIPPGFPVPYHLPVFWMLSFKPAFTLSSFTFIKKLFSSSSLSAISMVSSAYLRLLTFSPACASFSLTFHMMYSAYKLNKQGDNIQPLCTPFPIWNMFIVWWLFLTVASWPAYRFLRRQVKWSSIPISLRIFQFVMIYSQGL